MVKGRLLVALVAVVLGATAASGAAFAQDGRGTAPAAADVRGERGERDQRAFCERLESKIHQLRGALGRLEAIESHIERAIESGTLTEEQLVRARHALAKIERMEEALEEQLERALEVFEERCRR